MRYRGERITSKEYMYVIVIAAGTYEAKFKSIGQTTGMNTSIKFRKPYILSTKEA